MPIATMKSTVEGVYDKDPDTEEPDEAKVSPSGSGVAVGQATAPPTITWADTAFQRSHRLRFARAPTHKKIIAHSRLNSHRFSALFGLAFDQLPIQKTPLLFPTRPAPNCRNSRRFRFPNDLSLVFAYDTDWISDLRKLASIENVLDFRQI
jgi:hypothetical protein